MSDLLNQASLVMVPSGYKEDTVYSVVPSDGSGDMAFTRASNGTRVNSAGLVEVCPWNLVQYSEDFANAVWSKDPNLTRTTGQTDPNGTTTAALFTPTIATNGYVATSAVVPPNMACTFAIYIKGNANGQVTIRIDDTTTGPQYNINYTTSWQRFEVSRIVNTNNISVVVGGYGTWDLGQNLTLAFGQVNIGSTAKPYFPTTDRLNVPRLTYQNGGGGCPSLLLEKQSTNLVTYSEQFDNAGWTKNPNVSITANNTTSPDGTQNADKMTNSGSSNVQVYQLFSTSTALYTTTIYAKKGTNKYFGISLTSGGGAGDRYVVYFDLDSGSVHQVFNTATPLTNTSNSIQSVGNGWYRCVISADCNGQVYAVYQCTNNGTLSLATNGDLTNATNGDTYIWGAQCEASSYPTSYIPTTSSSATRVADACSKTGISGLIGQTSGSVFFDFEISNLSEAGGEKVLWYMKDTGTGERYVTLLNNGQLVYVESATSIIAQITKTGITVGRHKCAIGYANNDMVLYVDGVQAGTDTSGTPNGFSTFGLQYYTSGASGSQQVNQAVIFPTRLTNAELASLTTI